MASPAPSDNPFDQAQELARAAAPPAPIGDDDQLDLHDTDWDCKNGGDGDADDLAGEMEKGTRDSAPLLQGGAANGAGTQPAAAPAKPQQGTPMCACLTITYYRPFFDVDTDDVVARLRKALVPSAGDQSLLAEVQGKPDLYGPFWVCTTLIFVIGAAANFASWVYWDKNTTWVYDFTHVTYACAVVYGYVAGLPTVMWLGFKYLGAPISLLTLLCLYGYSMVPFIPAAMLCTTPVEALDWLALAAAFGLSIAVLLRNMWSLLQQHSEGTQGKVAVGVMVAAHALLAFLFKLLFFVHT